MADKIEKTDEEWREILTPEQYSVLRERGTETPNSGVYYHFNGKGVYICAGCGNRLFNSSAKYESGTGWPSFFGAASRDSVVTAPDRSLDRERTEVLCARCGGHLGHIFDDGPEPTGKRYCINSVALEFEEEE